MKQIVLHIQNNGKGIDITFPCEEYMLSKSLNKIGIADTVFGKRYTAEVVEPEELVCLENQELDLDEVNYLAKLMDGEDATKKKTLFAAAAYEGYDTPKELINLHFNLGCYTLIQPTDGAEIIGRRYMYSMKPGITVSERADTDFEKIGKELLASDKGIQTAYGILIRIEGVQEKEYYGGQVFPEYRYKGEDLLSSSAEYKGKKEYLYLPAEPEAISKALYRLGAEKPEDCIYHVNGFYNVEGRGWIERFEEMLQGENIFEVNSIAEKLNDWDMDLVKLEGVVKYAGADSIKTILKLAEHLDEFEFVDGATDYEEVGQYAVDRTFGSGIPDELEEYIDLDGVGRHMEEEYAGRFVDGGFVYNNEKKSIEEVLEDTRQQEIR